MFLCLHQNCLLFLSVVYSITQAVIFDVNERTMTERNEYFIGSPGLGPGDWVAFSKYLNISTIKCRQYV